MRIYFLIAGSMKNTLRPVVWHCTKGLFLHRLLFDTRNYVFSRGVAVLGQLVRTAPGNRIQGQQNEYFQLKIN